jgi:streptogramin lyase
MNTLFPQSQPPAAFKVAPMPQTQLKPASAMATRPRSVAPQWIGTLSWSQLLGAAASVAVAPDGSLFALSTAPAGANKYLWHYASGAWTNIPGLAASIAVAPNGTLYAVNSATGGLYSFYDGSWSALGGGATAVTTGADGSVYVLSNSVGAGGNAAIWKYASGVWTQQPGAGAQLAGSSDPQTYSVTGVGTVAPDGYFVVNGSGAVYYYSPGTGYVQFPGAPSGVGPTLGGVFALGYPASANGEGLYFFDYAGQGWASELGSGVSMAAGPGSGGTGTQLYVVNALTAIWRASFTSLIPAITEYPVLTASSAPDGIVAGRDGALWFTEFDGNKIGRITTGGIVNEYPIPTAGSLPDGIAAGPDGALWFAEETGNKIVRITIGGTITEYVVPTANSYPSGIAAGPDGALWFAEETGNKIGRITTGGTITEYAIPTAGGPYGIAAGPDGALWFTEYEGNKVGRITTGGTITEYAVPTAGSQPYGIAAGPDGALWFTESSNFGNKIGRITTCA